MTFSCKRCSSDFTGKDAKKPCSQKEQKAKSSVFLGRRIPLPISFPFMCDEAGSDSGKLRLKATEDNQKEIEDVTSSPADFLGGKDVFALCSAGFGMSFI